MNDHVLQGVLYFDQIKIWSGDDFQIRKNDKDRHAMLDVVQVEKDYDVGDRCELCQEKGQSQSL